MVRREPSRADYLVDLCLKYFFRAVIVSLMLGLFVELLMKLNVSNSESLPFQHLWVLTSDLLSNQEPEGEAQNFGGDLIRASIESFKVCLVAIALTIAIALPSGVVLGRLALMVPERRLIGRLFGGLGALFCLTIASMPGFLLAILLILYLVEYQAFPVFELIKEGSHGFDGKQAYLAAIWRLLLPAAVVAIPAAAWLTGELRRILRRTCAADFVQAAEDRALSGDRLYFSYVVKNSMRNIGGAIYRVFPFLLGSLILVEWLFHFQGIGLMIWSAAADKDFLKLFAAGLVSALMVMTCGFLLELLFGLIDRKTRQQGGVSLMIGNGVARAIGNKQTRQKMLKRMKKAWALVLLFVCTLIVIYFLIDRETGRGLILRAVSETLFWGMGLSLVAVIFSFLISACLAYLSGGHFYHWTSRIHASVITVPAMYWLLAGAAVFVTEAGSLFVINKALGLSCLSTQNPPMLPVKQKTRP